VTAAWRWVSKQALILLHDESRAEHGGLPGIRNAGLLESALARPLNLAAYGQPDAAELAACYGAGIAQNHPSADGNKRAGSRPSASPPDERQATRGHAARGHGDMLRLAAGALTETELAERGRQHIADR